MRKSGSGGLVYSTESGRMCPGCRQPVAACVCGKPQRPAGDGVGRVSREKAGRGGKTVTVVREAWPLADAELAALGQKLRAACGTGGTVKEGVVELQGDHAEKVVAWLLAQGHRAKRSGG
jgi:translation initiation factor 1